MRPKADPMARTLKIKIIQWMFVNFLKLWIFHNILIYCYFNFAFQFEFSSVLNQILLNFRATFLFTLTNSAYYSSLNFVLVLLISSHIMFFLEHERFISVLDHVFCSMSDMLFGDQRPFFTIWKNAFQDLWIFLLVPFSTLL